MKINTTEYELSHGRAPRGRGAWAFQLDGTNTTVWSPSMTYTAAVKWMRQTRAVSKDTVLIVLP
ncbi:MAG: hypothetical protein EBR88_01585 [Betaproteobacteria bacterium]|nr:hypothetical protein [Betaproteobacteria bacterium]